MGNEKMTTFMCLSKDVCKQKAKTCKYVYASPCKWAAQLNLTNYLSREFNQQLHFSNTQHRLEADFFLSFAMYGCLKNSQKKGEVVIRKQTHSNYLH